jgi:hypothetical protein
MHFSYQWSPRRTLGDSMEFEEQIRTGEIQLEGQDCSDQLSSSATSPLRGKGRGRGRGRGALLPSALMPGEVQCERILRFICKVD